MLEVPANEFYAVIGPLNAHPRIVKMDKHGCMSDFEMQDGTRDVIGRVVTWFSPDAKRVYYLATGNPRARVRMSPPA